MGIFLKFLAFFTMPVPQIWLCHVIQDANFENFYFVLILHVIPIAHTIEKPF